MKRFLLLTCAILACFQGSVYGEPKYTTMSVSDKHRVELIDSQVQSLDNLKEYYLARAARRRNKGDRLQFNNKDEDLATAQKDWQSADEYVKVAHQIQEQIDKLEKEKADILARS